MKLQRIPLENQLEQLKKGIPAHPEFNASAIRSWADTSLGEWFGAERKAIERLSEILRIPGRKAETLPYKDAAALTAELWKNSERKEDADEALGLLALPFIRYYRERGSGYGESGQDAS